MCHSNKRRRFSLSGGHCCRAYFVVYPLLGPVYYCFELYYWDTVRIKKAVHYHSKSNHSWWRHQMVKFWLLALGYWPFVMGIHRWPVGSPHKDQWSGALMFSFICAGTNGWANSRDAGDMIRHGTHYDVTVMISCSLILGWRSRKLGIFTWNPIIGMIVNVPSHMLAAPNVKVESYMVMISDDSNLWVEKQ